MATVTKKDLIDRIAQATGQKRTVVKQTVQSLLDEIVNELGRGNRLEFRDFGVFEIKSRAPRTAQNPKTLQPVAVPARRTVKFKVGRLMKQSVDENGVLSKAASAKPVVVTRPAREPSITVTANGKRRAARA